MPRRMRVSKRRQAEPLEVAAALAAANVHGCAGIPPDVSLAELETMHERALPQRSASSWAFLAFEVRHPQPCAALEVWDPFEGRATAAGITCGTACRFPAGTAAA